MATRPDPSLALFARRARLPEVASLFEQLADRATTYAGMHDEFLEGIVRNREARTGQPVRLTKGQQRFLDECDKDAEQSVLEMERLVAGMDDRCLLDSALTNECQQLEMDERMASCHRPEDQEMAQRLMEFRRETIRLIEQCIELSPFKGQIAYVRRARKKTKTA